MSAVARRERSPATGSMPMEAYSTLGDIKDRVPVRRAAHQRSSPDDAMFRELLVRLRKMLKNRSSGGS
jgi:hypothetical protein